MKKTKSCIALICAVVMLMTAFVVVPVTANAEGQKASISGDTYPKLLVQLRIKTGNTKKQLLALIMVVHLIFGLIKMKLLLVQH